VTLFDGANAAGTAIATNGVYTITTTNSPGTGVHSYTARATDVAGNVSLASDALAVTIDRTRPTAPTGLDLIATSDTGVSSTDNITQVTTPTITGAAVAGTLVKLFEGTTLLGSATTSDTGTWSIVTTALADGVHTLRATATDAAGNVSTNSNSLSVTVDNLAPAAPVLTTLNATRLAGTGPGAAGGTVTLFDGAATLGIAPVGPGGNWNWTFLSPLTNETHVFTAIASDAAGNVGAASGSAQIGTAGADTLTSTAGNDLLRGGGGGDTFVFAANFGTDVIADFRAAGAAHDIINFHAVAPLSDFTSVLSHATQVGSNVVISPDGTNALTLSNVTKTSLIAGDFTFV